MKAIHYNCPDCHEEVEMEACVYDSDEAEFWSDEATVLTFLCCPKCRHHFTGTLHYTFSHLGEVEHNEDYDDEDYSEDEEDE